MPIPDFINEEKALPVFKKLEEWWKMKKGVFANIVLPQDIYPAPRQPVEHANWYSFCGLAMRGGIVSDTPFSLLYSMRTYFPSVFDPQSVSQNWPPERIEKAFSFVAKHAANGNGSNGTGKAGSLSYKISEHARHWHANSITLHRRWDNNFLNVFDGVDDFEQAYAYIDYERNELGLWGKRRKIFSLETIWLQEKGLIKKFPTPLPIDFHALRVMLCTGIISFDSLAKPLIPAKQRKIPYPQFLVGTPFVRVSEKLVDAVTLWTQDFMQRNDLDHLAINPAIWTLSRELCAQHTQNSWNDERGFATEEQLKKNPGLWRKDPCIKCPLEENCSGTVSVGPYYRWGILIHKPRVLHLQPGLAGVFWRDFIPHKSIKNKKAH